MAAGRGLGGRIGFLGAAFLLVALAGFVASYAPTVPLVRALRREAALDQVLAAAQQGGDVAARVRSQLRALGPALGSSARAIAAGGTGADIAASIAKEKAAVRRRFTAQSAALARTTRWTLGLLTLLAFGFGALLLSLDRSRG
ncbi:MAG: hypothetical protein ACP5NI_00955 [Acetobacteraceae bacterium]